MTVNISDTCVSMQKGGFDLSDFMDRCGLAWRSPSNLSKAIETWRLGTTKYGLVLWRIVPFAIILTMWKERNEKIFRESLSLKPLHSMTAIQIAKWVLIRKESAIRKINDILFNWETCMVCGAIEGKEAGALVGM